MRTLSPLSRVALQGAHRALAVGDGVVLSTASGELVGLGPKLEERWRVAGAVPEGGQLTALPGGRVATWGAAQALRVFEAGVEALSLDHGRGWGGNQVHQVELLEDGRLLTVDEQGLLRAWDLQSGRSVELRKEMRSPRLLGRFPDGRWALQGSQLCVIDVAAGKVDHRFIAGTSVSAAAVTSTGLLAIAGKYGRLSVWTPEGKKLSEVDMGGFEAVEDLLPLPDGRLLAWGEGGQVWLHDGREGALVKLHGHKETVRHGALLGGGQAVTAGDDPALQRWDLREGVDDAARALGAMEGHGAEVTMLLALPGGRLLSAAGGELLLWDPPGLSARLEGQEGASLGALSLGDGRLLSWSASGLTLWPSPSAAPAAPQPAASPAPRPAAAARPAEPAAPPVASPLPARPAPPPAAPSRSAPPPAPTAPRPKERTPKEAPPPAAEEPPRLAPPARPLPSKDAAPKAPPEAPAAEVVAKRQSSVEANFDAELAQLSARPMLDTMIDDDAALEAERHRRAVLYAAFGGVFGSVLCFPAGTVLGAWYGWKQGRAYRG